MRRKVAHNKDESNKHDTNAFSTRVLSLALKHHGLRCELSVRRLSMFKLREPIRRPVAHAALFVPWITNFILAGIQVSVNVFQLFVLPLYFLPKGMRWSLVLIPIAALNNPFWALIHGAVHDLFSSSSRTNLGAGRLLSVFFGSPFHVLRLTHLSHHKFDRSPLEKGTEVYDPTRVSNLRANFKYFFYIFCGLYLLEVSSAFLFFLPERCFHRLGRRLSNKDNDQEKWLARKFMDDKLLKRFGQTVSQFC
jgi:hypothetical protein